MAITLPVSIPSTATDALQPVDEFLMKGLDTNQKYIASQIDTSGGGGGGGGGGVVVIGEYRTGIEYYDEIVSGGKSNEGKISRVRYRPIPQSVTYNAKGSSSIDTTLIDEGKRNISYSKGTVLTSTVDVTGFMGQYILLPKGKEYLYEIKEGENYFGVRMHSSTSYSDRVEFWVDGTQTPSSLGWTDENGNPSPNFYSANPIRLWGWTFQFMNLDGKAHTIRIYNNDSASKGFLLDGFESGYISPNPTLTNIVSMTGGTVASGKVFNEGDYQFDENTYSGHLGAVVLKPDGTTYALNGETSYTGKVKAGTQIDFSTKPTSLPTQGNLPFPANGICFLTLDTGENYFFSYNGKTDANINDSRLTNIIWDFVPPYNIMANYWLDDYNVVDVGKTQDFIINYYGTAPILIDNTNNKLDFSLKVLGITNNYSITIPNGRYAAKMISIGKTICSLMKATTNINGIFTMEYDTKTHLWGIGADGYGVEEFKLLFLSGPNSSISIAPTLGFSSLDYINELFYQAELEREHLCCLPYIKGELLDYTSPKFKIPGTSTITNVANEVLQAKESYLPLTLGYAYGQNSPQHNEIIFSPTPNSCGIELTLLASNLTSVVYIQIDHHSNYKLNPWQASGFNTKSCTWIITFPKFTKVVRIYSEPYVGSVTQYNLNFQFIKELFHKPAFEKLKVGEKIIKTFEICPTIFYNNLIGSLNGPYSPQGANDPIKSYIEAGTWLSDGPNGTYFTHHMRYGNPVGNSIEIKFEIKKDGGGFAIYFRCLNTASVAYLAVVRIYLTNSAAINETTDLLDNYSTIPQNEMVVVKSITGLKAGTYIIRIKKVNPTNTSYTVGINAFNIIDGKINSTETVSAISLNQYSIPFPQNTVQVCNLTDDEQETTATEIRNRNDTKRYSNNFIFHNSNVNTWSDLSTAKIGQVQNFAFGQDRMYMVWMGTALTGSRAIAMGREIIFTESDSSGLSTSVNRYLNGVSIETFNNGIPYVKSGGIATASGTHYGIPKRKNNLELNCTFTSGTTFSVSNTAMFRVGQNILISDGATKEHAKVISFVTNASVTLGAFSLIPASVNKMYGYGLQCVSIYNNTSVVWVFQSTQVVPLIITPSEYFQKESFKGTATALYMGVGTGNYSFPIFPDGSRGTPNNTIAVVTKISAAGVIYNLSLGGGGLTATISGGTIDLRLTSVK